MDFKKGDKVTVIFDAIVMMTNNMASGIPIIEVALDNVGGHPENFFFVNGQIEEHIKKRI